MEEEKILLRIKKIIARPKNVCQVLLIQRMNHVFRKPFRPVSHESGQLLLETTFTTL